MNVVKQIPENLSRLSVKSQVRGKTYHSRSKQRTDQGVLVFTLNFLALKKLVFPQYKILPKIFLTLVYLYPMQLFSADPTIFSKKD